MPMNVSWPDDPPPPKPEAKVQPEPVEKLEDTPEDGTAGEMEQVE